MASPKKRSKSSSTPPSSGGKGGSKGRQSKLTKRLHLLWRRAFWVVNLVLLVPVVLSLLAPWVSPVDAPFLGYLGLGVPGLVFLPVLGVVFWSIYHLRYAGLNLVVLLLHLPNLTSWVQLSSPDDSPEKIRVVSYNVNAFYNQTDKFLATLATLKDLRPDILLLQEYYAKDNQRLGPITDTLRKTLGLKNVAFLPLYPPNFGLVVFSRYKIEKHGRLWPERQDTIVTNGVQFADISLYGATLRVYNVHLQSYFTLAEVTGDEKQPFQQPERASQFRALLAALPAAWAVQQQQLAALRADRATCPHLQLVGGDLNNPPFGYAYFRATRGLTDAFRAKGSGWGTTYKHPYIKYRIDYLAVDPAFEVLGYKTPNVGVSDHLPVVVDLFWQAETDEDKVY